MFEFKKPQTSPKATAGLMGSLKALSKGKKSIKVVTSNKDSSDSERQSSVLTLSEFDAMVSKETRG